MVDDGSAPATGELLGAERRRGGLNLATLRQPHALGPATARERGWRATEADLIAFIDDDCVPEPQWLDALDRVARQRQCCFVQGPTVPDPDELAALGPFSHTISVPGLDPSFPTCNIAYPRELLERIGGFDTASFGRAPGGEDCDLAWRAIAAGARPAFAAPARVRHAVEDLGPLGKLGLAARWAQPLTAYARHRELRRRAFRFGIFWKDLHWLAFRALIGLVLPGRWHALRAWLVYPYLRQVWARARLPGGGPTLIPYFILHDLIEIAAVARAALRTRTLML